MFGQRLRELRLSKRMSQEELGSVLNASQQTIGNWERGRTFPTEDSVIQIANYFNVTIDYLYGEESESVNKNVVELEKLMDNQVAMSFGGETLTESEEDRVKAILEYVFWEIAKSKNKD